MGFMSAPDEWVYYSDASYHYDSDGEDKPLLLGRFSREGAAIGSSLTLGQQPEQRVRSLLGHEIGLPLGEPDLEFTESGPPTTTSRTRCTGSPATSATWRARTSLSKKKSTLPRSK